MGDENMQIEVLEDFLHWETRFTTGDTVTVSSEDGEYFCANGWALDVAQKVITGERATSTSQPILNIPLSAIGVRDSNG